MTTFPDTLPNPRYMSRGARTKHQVRTPTEAGYVQSRPRHTRTRGGPYQLEYKLRPDELDTLMDFFDANAGGMFAYPFLGTGDYRFSQDKVEWVWDGYNRYVVTVEMEEV